MEPGPAGDLMFAHLTASTENQFFFNSKYLNVWQNTTSKAKLLMLPGGYYFTKISKFVKDHFDIDDLYMEFLMGKCEERTGELCSFRELSPLTKTKTCTQAFSRHYTATCNALLSL